ncbi:MAG: stage III sporulation protein AF, partial [Oscillospiraceae bacterium]|nr:stage III sporulation protein AF [Oscillospiraceae bacterium]
QTIIEETAAAYIVDKAEEMGIPCQAEVTFSYDEDGVPCPWEITARGVWTQEQREALSRLLEDDLGVPIQRQHYEERLP